MPSWFQCPSDADEPVVRDDRGQRRLDAEARLAAGRKQRRLLLDEAVDRPLVGRAVDLSGVPDLRARVRR
jgi:hypothetical protein